MLEQASRRGMELQAEEAAEGEGCDEELEGDQDASDGGATELGPQS